MKHIKAIVEIDLGIAMDDFKVTLDGCHNQIRVGDLINAPYELWEVRTFDLDTKLMTDFLVPEEAP